MTGGFTHHYAIITLGFIPMKSVSHYITVRLMSLVVYKNYLGLNILKYSLKFIDTIGPLLHKGIPTFLFFFLNMSM